MANIDFSYVPITAATSSQTDGVDYLQVLEAINHRDKTTFLKLMWQASAGSALASQQLEKLETDRVRLKKQLDAFTLALTELQNAPAKSLTEEQYKQRLSASQELTQVLNKLKTDMSNLDNEITYMNDYNEDMQKKFREKMAKYLKKIPKEILASAELQDAYLKAAGQEGKGFMNRLKGWFK